MTYSGVQREERVSNPTMEGLFLRRNNSSRTAVMIVFKSARSGNIIEDLVSSSDGKVIRYPFSSLISLPILLSFGTDDTLK